MGIKGHLWLPNKLETNLGYVKLCLHKKQNNSQSKTLNLEKQSDRETGGMFVKVDLMNSVKSTVDRVFPPFEEGM